MNRLVESWNRQEQRRRYVGPDSVKIDDDELKPLESIEMAERKADTKPDAVPTDETNQSSGAATITVNKHAVTELVIYGSQDRVEILLRETHRTLKRIGIRAGKAPTIKNPERGKGAPPNILDMVRWLESLHKGHSDLAFFKSIHKTLVQRVSPGFLKSLGK